MKSAIAAFALLGILAPSVTVPSVAFAQDETIEYPSEGEAPAENQTQSGETPSQPEVPTETGEHEGDVRAPSEPDTPAENGPEPDAKESPSAAEQAPIAGALSAVEAVVPGTPTKVKGTASGTLVTLDWAAGATSRAWNGLADIPGANAASAASWAVAVSHDGSVVALGRPGGAVYVSTDSGESFIEQTALGAAESGGS